MELSRMCEGKLTSTIKVEPLLATISLPMGCSAFGESLTLPSYYQAEEKYETSDSFLFLAEV